MEGGWEGLKEGAAGRRRTHRESSGGKRTRGRARGIDVGRRDGGRREFEGNAGELFMAHQRKILTSVSLPPSLLVLPPCPPSLPSLLPCPPSLPPYLPPLRTA